MRMFTSLLVFGAIYRISIPSLAMAEPILPRMASSAPQTSPQIQTPPCAAPAFRACHDNCEGVWGFVCFYGDVCNPSTHNCEHAQR